MQTLEQQSGVSARTLRHWIRQKVMPKPIGRGRGARYDDRHLLRARAVQHLRTAGKLSLSAIRARLNSLTDEQVSALIPRPPRPTTSEGVPIPPPAPTYPAETWEIVVLMEGLLLFVNPSKGAVLRRIADEIYRYYGAPRRLEP